MVNKATQHTTLASTFIPVPLLGVSVTSNLKQFHNHNHTLEELPKMGSNRSKQEATAGQRRAGEAEPGSDRVLHYYGGQRGQGLGNSVNGLWVAHIFAARFDRLVCVHWPDFSRAFRPKKREKECAMPASDDAVFVHSWNFGQKNTYSELNRTIGGSKREIRMDANDWPERLWPDMDSFLTDNYEPTPEFAKILPPGCELGLDNENCGSDNVLHLRHGDDSSNVRGVFACENPYETLRNAFKLEDYTVLTDKPGLAMRSLGLHQVRPCPYPEHHKRKHTPPLPFEWTRKKTRSTSALHTVLAGFSFCRGKFQKLSWDSPLISES